MAVLVRRRMDVRRTMLVSRAEAKALEDPARAKIVDILCGRTLTATQIADKLSRRGDKRALTTVRHHIDVLRTAGLVDVAKIEETRGGVTKHYGTSVRLLLHELPKDFAAKNSAAIGQATKSLAELMQNLDQKASAAPEKKADPAMRYYVVAEILNHAMTAVAEKEFGSRKPARKKAR